jgi:hypothetical protein
LLVDSTINRPQDSTPKLTGTTFRSATTAGNDISYRSTRRGRTRPTPKLRDFLHLFLDAAEAADSEDAKTANLRSFVSGFRK